MRPFPQRHHTHPNQYSPVMPAPDPMPERPERRRPFYYPAGWGLLYWLLFFLTIWLIVGLLWAPAWWPVWYW